MSQRTDRTSRVFNLSEKHRPKRVQCIITPSDRFCPKDYYNPVYRTSSMDYGSCYHTDKQFCYL